MTESNITEQQPSFSLEIDAYPTVHPISNDSSRIENSNNYKIESGILNGEEEDIVKMFENSIILDQQALLEFEKGFEILKYIYNLEGYNTVMEKDLNRYAINKIELPGEYNTVMNIFTGGVDITNGGSNVYLNSSNIINTENVKTYHQAKFLRDCLVKYFKIMGIKFDINSVSL